MYKVSETVLPIYINGQCPIIKTCSDVTLNLSSKDSIRWDFGSKTLKKSYLFKMEVFHCKKSANVNQIRIWTLKHKPPPVKLNIIKTVFTYMTISGSFGKWNPVLYSISIDFLWRSKKSLLMKETRNQLKSSTKCTIVNYHWAMSQIFQGEIHLTPLTPKFKIACWVNFHAFVAIC